MTSKRSLLSLGLPKDVLSNLTRHGYETVQDVRSAGAQDLINDLNLSAETAENLLNVCVNNKPPAPTQSAAIIAQRTEKMPTNSAALDALLDGGLSRGTVLEISGPPGSQKEKLAIGIVRSFAEAGQDVIFIDCAHMANPAVSNTALGTATQLDVRKKVHYAEISDLPKLLLFLHQIPRLLIARPELSLLVINSIAFPFQNPDIGQSQKNALLDRVKQSFSQLCAAHLLTIVTTSQLATKMVNADGSVGSFDSGARGVMLPYLGPAYLPKGKSYRVIVGSTGPISGFIKLLSSPTYPQGQTPSPVQQFSGIALT